VNSNLVIVFLKLVGITNLSTEESAGTVRENFICKQST